MSSTTASSSSVNRSVWVPGLIATAVAAGATTSVAALASAAGVTFADKTGASIPPSGFAILTVGFSLIGVVLAAVLARFAAHPRKAWIRTTIVLVLLSYIPDLLPSFGFDRVSGFTLIGLHTLAAVIVIPALASRLAD